MPNLTPPTPPQTNATRPTPPDRPLRIAAIGDVHDQWTETDGQLLAALNVDLALFVGDFGNESVEIVRAIAQLPQPKAVILGNHDAWYSATSWGRQKCPYDRHIEDRVQQQLQDLGADHVGYGSRDYADLGWAVVGGRPFSWGGSDWKNGDFYGDRYNVHSYADSCDRILAAARAYPANYPLIFLGHNGPTGLGAAAEDPCGRDWNPLGGDHGDPDLGAAITTLQREGRSIPLVVFGHMHHRLRHRRDRDRQRIATDAHGTVYLNAATVPRILPSADGRSTLHRFAIATLQEQWVQTIDFVSLDGRSGECVAGDRAWERCAPPTLKTA